MDVWLTIKVTEYEDLAGNGECDPDANDRHQDSFNCFRQYFQDQLFNHTFGKMTCKENFGNCSVPQVTLIKALLENSAHYHLLLLIDFLEIFSIIF